MMSAPGPLRTPDRGRTRPGRRLLGVVMAASVVLTGCTGEQSMFDPAGSGARSVDRLWLLMLTLGTAVFLLVLLMVGLAVFRGQRGDPEAGLSVRARTRLVVVAGVLIPIVILAVVFTSTLQALREVAGLASSDSLIIDVVGHQFWWEVN